MVTEDYVSFETAKLLKEKGFDWDCKQVYDLVRPQSCTDGKMYDNFPDKNPNAHNDLVSAPTLQQAMKWLREVHNKIIVPNISLDDKTSGTINYYIVGIWYIPKNNGGAFCYTSPTPYNGYSTPEEACEAAIKYCLKNLI